MTFLLLDRKDERIKSEIFKRKKLIRERGYDEQRGCESEGFNHYRSK